MGYRHQREDLLDAAVELALSDGLSSLTFGRLARHLGTNDRTVVYYFPTKHELVTEVALVLGAQLQDLLEEAFGPDRLSAADLVERAWPVLASTTADPVFAVFLELVGLAAAGHEPYADLAPLLVNGWVDWLAPRVDPSAPRSARREAHAIVAQVHGLLILRHISGARAANSAARHLGVIAD